MVSLTGKNAAKKVKERMKMEYKSKVDIIYDSLITGIVSGKYDFGDRLNIRQIAKENSISEIPVREALRRLESEGYITIYANQGAVINTVTEEDVKEIFQLKGLLEGYAARMAIDYLKEDDYKKLREINEELRVAKENKEFDICGELNVRFHMYMYNVLPNRRLKEMIDELWRKWRITKTVFRHSPDRGMHSVMEHEEILRLMEQKKYDKTEMCVRNHKYRAGLELAVHIKTNSHN